MYEILYSHNILASITYKMSLKTNNRHFIFIFSDAHSLLTIQTKIMKIDILKAFETIQLI